MSSKISPGIARCPIGGKITQSSEGLIRRFLDGLLFLDTPAPRHRHQPVPPTSWVRGQEQDSGWSEDPGRPCALKPENHRLKPYSTVRCLQNIFEGLNYCQYIFLAKIFF